MTEKKAKDFTTLEEQVNIFEGRKLKISDHDYTKRILINVNYYRLSGYALSMKDGEDFKEGSTFEKLYSLYEFDRKLRTLLLTVFCKQKVEKNAKKSLELCQPSFSLRMMI